MQNIKSVINNHNINILSNTAEIEKGCNCRNRNNCSRDGKRSTPNIIYEAQITSNQPNYNYQSLLTSVDTSTNLPFYGMISRTKSYVSTVIFLAAFPLEPAFWAARFMFCIMFSKTDMEQLRSTVSLENVAGNISCEGNTKMTSPFRLDTNTL